MRRLDSVALGLLAATALGAWLVDHVPAPWPLWAAASVALLALGKGVAVALVYMGLAQGPALWRRLVLGWLLGVWLAIALAWLAGSG